MVSLGNNEFVQQTGKMENLHLILLKLDIKREITINQQTINGDSVVLFSKVLHQSR
jgi:hypothetical protein